MSAARAAALAQNRRPNYEKKRLVIRFEMRRNEKNRSVCVCGESDLKAFKTLASDSKSSASGGTDSAVKMREQIGHMSHNPVVAMRFHDKVKSC